MHAREVDGTTVFFMTGAFGARQAGSFFSRGGKGIDTDFAPDEIVKIPPAVKKT